MSGSLIPAFYADSPDAAILSAYEQIRQARAYYYRFDAEPHDPARDAELATVEANTHDKMSFIEAGSNTTLEGVRVRLQLLCAELDSSRWLDRAMAEHGLLAILRDRQYADGHTQQVILAAAEILEIEWKQALASYETASEHYNLALKLKGCVEEEEFVSTGTTSVLLGKLNALVDEFEEAFCDTKQVHRVLRTLTPSHEALRVKLLIAAKECLTDYAAAWVARDVQFLAGLSANTDYEQAQGEA